jgi:hypothetical protein
MVTGTGGALVARVGDGGPDGSLQPPPSVASDDSSDHSPTLSPEQLERIIEAVEQRVIDELERRGLRHRPEVF